MVVLYPVFCWSYIRKFLIATGFRKLSYRKYLSLVIFLFHYQTWIVSFPTQYVYETLPWSVLLNQSWCIIKTSINNCCHITQTITFFPRKKIKLMSCIAYSWKWKIYYTSLVIGFRANHFIFISILYYSSVDNGGNWSSICIYNNSNIIILRPSCYSCIVV